MVVKRRLRGLTLVELLIATAIGAMLLSGLTSVARLGMQARVQTRDGHEALQQARFALDRVTLAAQATAPQTLLAPAANTSGTWFSPVYFCVNTAKALIETTTTDTTCTGTRVIADRVSAFNATLPASAGPLEAVTTVVSITTTGAQSGEAVTLSERIRLGGGTQ